MAMQYDVVFSGFGGQGALFAGQLLAYAAMDVGEHVTWIPSYGPEMRGGTAHCTVILSEEEIGSPLVRHPTYVVAFNNPSVERYEKLLASGGCLIYNASLVTHRLTRSDIRVVPIPASAVALELGSARLMNMVMLGALLAESGMLTHQMVEQALERHLPAHRRALLDQNKQALRRGQELARGVVAAA